jgi:5'/3'-nucleotidase SurE
VQSQDIKRIFQLTGNVQYVNSYPVTSIRYGIQNLSSTFFGGPPDIAVSGFNVGSNVNLATQFSGTVGAACEAVQQGVPAIAFSGASGSQTAWTAPVETYMTVYADLSTTVTSVLTAAGKPYLPTNIW